MSAALAAFLLGFPALFSIVNPVSGAFIFRTRTVDRSHAERARLAARAGCCSSVPFFIGMSVAAVLVAALYSASDQISRLLGQVASRAVTRLSAFFQLCIGVQILLTGVAEVLRPLLAR